MRENASVKMFVSSILLVSVLFLGMMSYIWANPGSSEIPIQKYSFGTEASYIISKHGSTIYMRAGDTGEIDASGTSASQIINWAIGNCSSGGKIFIKSGEYLLDTYITLIHGITIEGQGESTVLKQSDDSDLYMIFYAYLNTATEFGRYCLKNFVIDGNKENQNGMEGWGYGIYSDTYSSVNHDHVILKDLLIKNTYGTGVYINGNWHYVENVRVEDAGGDGFKIDDYRIRLSVCSAFDCAHNGFYIEGSGLHSLHQCSASNNGYSGINMTGKEAYGRLRTRILGGYVDTNDRHGILFDGASMCSVVEVLFYGNGADGSYDNIHFESEGIYHSENNIVESCTFWSNGKSGYHVREADSNQDNNLVKGNQFLDAGETGTIVLNGANSKAEGNMGFVTENSGTATISDSTSTTFSHGLAGQPDYFWASFNSTAYNGYTWSANSTHATITVGTSGNYTAYWRGIYEP